MINNLSRVTANNMLLRWKSHMVIKLHVEFNVHTYIVDVVALSRLGS